MSSNRTISSSFPGLDQIEAQTRSLRSAVLSLEDYAEWSRADPTIPTVHGAVRPTDENRDDPDGLNLIFGLKALLYPRPPAISSALLSGGGAALPSSRATALLAAFRSVLERPRNAVLLPNKWQLRRNSEPTCVLERALIFPLPDRSVREFVK